MNINQFKTAIKVSYKSNRPIIGLGSPGLGKSAAVQQCTEELAADYDKPFGLIEIRGASLNPGEVADIKYIKGDFIENAIQNWVPSEEKVAKGECPPNGIIFLDELGDALMSVQSTLQRLLLDRKLGSATLAPGWRTAAASNRAKDRAAAGRLSRALINRAMVVTVLPDPDLFYSWGLANDIDYRVLAFVRFRPESVNDGLEVHKNDNQAFCSPRSLHITSDILQCGESMGEALENELIEGTLGDAVGTEFNGFRRIMDDLPDLDKLIADPKNYPVPNTINVQYATLGALHQRMTVKNTQAIMQFFARLPTEMSVVAIKDAGKIAAQKLGDGNLVFRTPEFRRWASDNIRFAV